uniref:Methionyl-tRNA formyltransferase n=1 Tax=Eiseniibacteriota bacterium TaxID=2212470 RepID=A0A832MN91_UNCEI
MGTPAFATPSLEAVARACDVVAVVTQPDRPRGRGLRAAPSAVAERAQALGLDTLKPASPNDESVRADLARRGADLFAVVAFGAILSPALLATPRLGAINLHGSLLPDYRGASPVQAALRDGRVATGVTTLWMDEGVDTGDVILQRWTPVAPDEDAGALAARLAVLGAPLLAESLLLAHAGRAPRHPQDRARGSYARRLRKEHGAMDWTRPAEALWHHVRAMTPWPGATAWHHGRRLQVSRAVPLHLLPAGAPPGTVVAAGADGVDVACGAGVLRLARVRPEGRAEMDAAEWARGARLEPGERLTANEGAHT